MYIKRFIDGQLPKLLSPGRVVSLFGPRRTGKTTALKTLAANYQGRVGFFNGDEIEVAKTFSSQSGPAIRGAFAPFDLVIIDEAQSIPGIGLGLKILVDTLPSVRVIASGSSSFNLATQIGEPLTGRRIPLTLYPVSAAELAASGGGIAVTQQLETELIYGSYPEVFVTEALDAKERLLRTLVVDYLYKDILSFERIRDASKLGDLLRLLAFQLGKEVSIHELGQNLALSSPTVERYLDLLEKCFVIFRVSAYSTNPRKEIVKSKRFYFRDNGILNAVQGSFRPLVLRRGEEVGALWENWLATERCKAQNDHGLFVNNCFWRSRTQQEVDWVEERDGALAGFEFKWSVTGRVRHAPSLWQTTYPKASYTVVDRTGFLPFVSGALDPAAHLC